jgi:hypothetical protein
MNTLNSPATFDTVTQALAWLGLQGFNYDFNRDDEPTSKLLAAGNDFVVSHIFHFDNNTDPADENIIYAISSIKHNLKGVILSAYGVYADERSSSLLMSIQYNGNLY